MGSQNKSRTLMLCLVAVLGCLEARAASVRIRNWDSLVDPVDRTGKRITWDSHFDALDRAAKSRPSARSAQRDQPEIPVVETVPVEMEIPYIYDPRDPKDQKYTKNFLVRDTSGGNYIVQEDNSGNYRAYDTKDEKIIKRGNMSESLPGTPDMIWTPIDILK